MCGESWVARQRPQRRRGRATVPPVDPAARVRVREAQAAAFAGRAAGEGPIMSRYRNQVRLPASIASMTPAPEQGSAIKFAPASVFDETPSKRRSNAGCRWSPEPDAATVACAVRPGNAGAHRVDRHSTRTRVSASAETHRGWIVPRSNRKTARHWQGNGLQNRKSGAVDVETEEHFIAL